MRHHPLCTIARRLFITAQHLLPILDTMAAVIGTMIAMTGVVANGVAGMTVGGDNRYIEQ
jgi:hypothetical protein